MMKHPAEILEMIDLLEKRKSDLKTNIEVWEKADRKIRNDATLELAKPEDEQDWSRVNLFDRSYGAARESLEIEYDECCAKISALKWVLGTN